MNRLLVIFVLLTVAFSDANAGSPPDIYSTNFWEITGVAGNVTWVEIHNSKEAQTNGVAYVSVITRKQGAPVWQLEWLCPHIAITTEALKRSVIRPFKTREAYPERYFEAHARWLEDQKKGVSVICSTSVQDCLKQR